MVQIKDITQAEKASARAISLDRQPSIYLRLYTLLYILLLIAYSLTILINASKAYQMVPPTSPYLTEVVNNWNTYIITDIVENQTCPTNYTPIYNYSFAGTTNGCNC